MAENPTESLLLSFLVNLLGGLTDDGHKGWLHYNGRLFLPVLIQKVTYWELVTVTIRRARVSLWLIQILLLISISLLDLFLLTLQLVVNHSLHETFVAYYFFRNGVYVGVVSFFSK